MANKDKAMNEFDWKQGVYANLQGGRIDGGLIFCCCLELCVGQ
jgi:hypothetical protein